jgi:DNA-binding HxlR family transcriptional regulator
MPLQRSEYSAENCTIRRTLDVVGEKWTLLVLREAFYGVRRFDEFAENVGCGRAILSQRLKKLAREGLLAPAPYREPGQRQRVEYRLTQKGLDLYPALLALMQWGDRHAADDSGPPLTLTHRDCGEPIAVALTCERGHGPLTARDVRVAPGPGAMPKADQKAA